MPTPSQPLVFPVMDDPERWDNPVLTHDDTDEADEAELSPVLGSLPPAPEFPMDALGPKAERTARAFQVLSGGTPYVLCVVALIGAANCVLQGLMDVKLFEKARPISLNLLLIGPSGGRKSTVLNMAMAAIEAFAKVLLHRYKKLVAQLRAQGLDKEAKALKPPMLTLSDTSQAALRDILGWSTIGTLGLILDEAAMFVKGYGMGGEQRGRMAGIMSKLFDGAMVSIARSDNIVTIEDKRFMTLMMGQWELVREFIGDRTCRAQGLHSRFLMFYPDYTMGRRSEYTIEEKEAARRDLEAYQTWMNGVLGCEPNIHDGIPGMLNPPVMTLSPEAEELLTGFCRELEQYCGRLGEHNPMLDHVNKMPELAVRMAATLQLIEQGGPDNLGSRHVDHPWTLDGENMQRGLQFIRYALKEKERLNAPPPVSEEREDAALLLSHLGEHGLTSFTRTDLYKSTIGRLRDKKVVDKAIELLTEYGYLEFRVLPRRGKARKSAILYSLTPVGLANLNRKTAA